MGRFRKKPVVIEAVQYDPDDPDGGDAMMQHLNGCTGWHMSDGELGIVIPTLEGDHLARPGDWIIKGVHGEFYPCKPSPLDAASSCWGAASSGGNSPTGVPSPGTDGAAARLNQLVLT